VHIAVAFNLPLSSKPMRPAVTLSAFPLMQTGRESDDVAGAVANTFGDVFSSLFKPSAEKQAEIDRAYAEQLEVAERRRNPDAYRKKIRETEERRERASREFAESIAWQRGANPLEAFKRRQREGKVKPLGYEDEPKGGIPLPGASFGVGGEFGVGGKYDNGQRFDLRLPFVDQGWVDESSTLKRKTYAKGEQKPKVAPKRNWWEPKPKAAAPPKAQTPSAPPPAPKNPLEWWIRQTTKG